MPWDVGDVDRHMKDLSPKQKETWVEIANKALASCEKAGRKDCDASAIRQANAVVGKLKEGELATETISLRGKLIGALFPPDAREEAEALWNRANKEVFGQDALVEAATFKTKVQGLLDSANGVVVYKSVPKAVKTKIQELRALLHKTWGDLSDTTSAPEGGAGKASAASEAIGGPAESSEEFVEVGELVAQGKE